MKLTKSELQQIIKEELDNILGETDEDPKAEYPEHFEAAVEDFMFTDSFINPRVASRAYMGDRSEKDVEKSLRLHLQEPSFGKPGRRSWLGQLGLDTGVPYEYRESLIQAAKEEAKSRVKAMQQKDREENPEKYEKPEIEPESPEQERQQRIAHGKRMALGQEEGGYGSLD